MNEIKKIREMISVAVFLAVIAVVYFFAVNPSVVGAFKKAEKIQEGKMDYQAEVEKGLVFSEMKKEYEKIMEEEKKIGILIGRDEAINIIRSLEKIAEETGNEIKITIQDEALSVAKKKTPGKKGEEALPGIAEHLSSDKHISFNIILTGRYPALLNFISRMENLNYYNDITSFNFTVVEKEVEEQKNDNGIAASGAVQGAAVKEKAVKAVIDSIFYVKD